MAFFRCLFEKASDKTNNAVGLQSKKNLLKNEKTYFKVRSGTP